MVDKDISNEHASAFLTPFPGMLAQAMMQILQHHQHLHIGRLPTLPNQSLQVQLEGLGMTLLFTGNAERKILVNAIPSVNINREVTTIGASPVTLMLQAITGQPGGKLSINGDAGVAQHWQVYFSLLNPDWEQGLSERLGPIMGVQAYKAISSFRDWLQAAIQHSGEMTGEFLREESHLLVTRVELDQFLDGVDDVSLRFERLLARYNA